MIIHDRDITDMELEQMNELRVAINNNVVHAVQSATNGSMLEEALKAQVGVLALTELVAMMMNMLRTEMFHENLSDEYISDIVEYFFTEMEDKCGEEAMMKAREFQQERMMAIIESDGEAKH